MPADFEHIMQVRFGREALISELMIKKSFLEI